MADSAIPAALTRRNFRRFMALFLSRSRDKHKSSTRWRADAESQGIGMPPIARRDQILFSFGRNVPSSKRNIRPKYVLWKTKHSCARLEIGGHRPLAFAFIPP